MDEGRSFRLSGPAVLLRNLQAVEDRVFVEWRLRFYGAAAVGAIVIALGWGLHRGLWLYRPDGRFGAIDFCWIWFSGNFARTGDPSQIYNSVVYDAAYNRFYSPGDCHLLLSGYIYPPTFLFFTYLIGLLPHLLAFAVWVGATLLFYVAVVWLVVPGWTTAVAALTPFAVPLNISLGHNGFLTGALIGLSLVLFERRPWLAGMLLGLLTYKPQFGVLFPLALLASRNWRTLLAAAATGLAFGVAAALVFGLGTWPAFLASLFGRTADLSPQAGVELFLGSVYGLVHRAGAGLPVAWAVQSIVGAGLAAAVWVVWARPIAYPLKAALIATAALLVTPYLLGYDLAILSVAAAFLVKDGLARGFLAGERTTILFCLGVLYFPVASIAPAVCVILLFLIFRRMAAAPGDDPVGGGAVPAVRGLSGP